MAEDPAWPEIRHWHAERSGGMADKDPPWPEIKRQLEEGSGVKLGEFDRIVWERMEELTERFDLIDDPEEAVTLIELARNRIELMLAMLMQIRIQNDIIYDLLAECRRSG